MVLCLPGPHVPGESWVGGRADRKGRIERVSPEGKIEGPVAGLVEWRGRIDGWLCQGIGKYFLAVDTRG